MAKINEAKMVEEVQNMAEAEAEEEKSQQKVSELAEMRQTKVRTADAKEGVKQIILPPGMSIPQAMRTMYLHKKERDSEVAISETIDAYPLDGAVQFHRTLKELYGWPRLIPTPGFFGDNPPEMIGVKIDAHGKTIQVPWGRVELPNIDGYLQTGWDEIDDRKVFKIQGVVKRKNEKAIAALAQRVRDRCLSESIYRSKAIKIDFRDREGDLKEWSPQDCPRFIDLQDKTSQSVVYPRDVELVVNTTLFNPVLHSEACRLNGIPLKRGALLEGEYGTGKTMTAYSLAAACVKHGWTFIYVGDVRDLDQAIAFAAHYEPCVIFAEDVDQVAKFVGRRSDEMNRVLNTLDGIDSKDHELMVILTTNFKEDIDPAFYRPGRIDSVVSITPPDADATVRLVRQYAKDAEGNSVLAPKTTDKQIESVMKPLIDRKANAAFIREAVERAKLSAVAAPSALEGNLVITTDDLKVAALSEVAHLELHKSQMDTEPQLDPVLASLGSDDESQKQAKAIAKHLLKNLSRR